MKNIIKQLLNLAGLSITKTDKNMKFGIDAYNDLYDKIHERCAPEVNASVDKKKRKYLIYQCMQNLCLNKAEVVTAEFGVYKGQTSMLINEVALQNEVTNHHYIFDSFEGLSEPKKVDGSKNKNMENAMSPNMENIKLLFPNAYLHKVWIPDEMPQNFNVTFDLVHIDVDLYVPVKGSLEWVKTRMKKNGVIIVDDYNQRWPGCVKAVDEFISENNYKGIDTLNGNFLIFTK